MKEDLLIIDVRNDQDLVLNGGTIPAEAVRKAFTAAMDGAFAAIL